MNTKEQIRDIFECNIPVCNTISRSEQFKIWEDGFRVGHINGIDDAKEGRECVESAARNADIQDAYERGYEDGVRHKQVCDEENYFYCPNCECGGKHWNLYNYCPICGLKKVGVAKNE